MIPTYEKIFARAFCLGTVEVWCDAETTDVKQWTKELQPFLPFQIFERQKETVAVYLDTRGIAWMKQEMKRLMLKDPFYARKVGDMFHKHIEEIKPLLDAEPALSLQEFKTFVSKLRITWSWFEAIWWLIGLFEDEERKGKELDRLLDIRKKGESVGPSADAIIRNSVAAIYPNYKAYADVIALEESLSGKLPPLEELKARQKGYFYTDNQIFINKTRSFIELKYKMKFPRIKSQDTELRGKVAYSGKVEGRVCIIRSREEVVKMKSGGILVSPMTTPDFLPAIIKASAIVTDEGGIVSHASIIARELKKPCIIGTKFATELLHDGDLVEVDANKGTIKLLNKK